MRGAPQVGFSATMRRSGANLFADPLTPPTCLALETHVQYKRNPAPMPAHDGSRSDQDERLCPPGPERTKRDQNNLCRAVNRREVVWRAELAIADGAPGFRGRALPGTESADHPARRCRSHTIMQNLIGTVRIELFAKSFTLRVYAVLARHNAQNASTSATWRSAAPTDPGGPCSRFRMGPFPSFVRNDEKQSSSPP